MVAVDDMLSVLVGCMVSGDYRLNDVEVAVMIARGAVVAADGTEWTAVADGIVWAVVADGILVAAVAAEGVCEAEVGVAVTAAPEEMEEEHTAGPWTVVTAD